MSTVCWNTFQRPWRMLLHQFEQYFVGIHEGKKPNNCKIWDKNLKKVLFSFLRYILEIHHTFGTHIKFPVDWYLICTCYKVSDNSWFSDSFPGDQKCSTAHFFESPHPCEDKMSIKKVFHFWPSEIAASVHGRYGQSRLDWPHKLAAISEGHKWKTFLMLILSSHEYRGSKKCTLNIVPFCLG